MDASQYQISIRGDYKAVGSSHGGFLDCTLEPNHIEVLAKTQENREADAYQYLVKTPLKRAISNFYGVHTINGQRYIVIADQTAGFSSPCMADLKVCVRHFNPKYSPEKVAHLRERDMRSTSARYGLRLIDVLVRKERKVVKHYTRQQGKVMKIDEVKHAISDYLPSQSLKRVFAQKMQVIIDSLEQMKKVNPHFRVFQSSVLCVYDGDAVDENGNIPEDKMRVNLVDFAYMYQDIRKETNEELNDGILLGCNTLLSFVKEQMNGNSNRL